MRFFQFCCTFLIAVTTLTAQEDFQNVQVKASPDSELVIIGSTNVNKFYCHFNIELINKPIPVKFAESDTEIKFDEVKLRLVTNGFDCGNKRMNSDFQDLLVADHYPEIVIEINKVTLISASYVKANISVNIANKVKNYDLPVKIENNRFEGKFKINIRHFGLEPPKKALGLIEVDEMIEIQFNMKFS